MALPVPACVQFHCWSDLPESEDLHDATITVPSDWSESAWLDVGTGVQSHRTPLRRLPPATGRAPVVVVTTLPVTPAPSITVVAPPPEPIAQIAEPVTIKEDPPELVQTEYKSPLSGATEKMVDRRSFADITADPKYGHAPDYSWLVGELQFNRLRNTWRVRYASVDEEDPYGGSVTLVEVGSLTEFTSGQIVRVEGQFDNPESREPSPPYRVRLIQAASRETPAVLSSSETIDVLPPLK